MTKNAAATVTGLGLYVDSIICEVGETVENALARHGYTSEDRVIVHVIVAPDPNRWPARKPSLVADNVISLSEVPRPPKKPRCVYSRS